MKKLFKNLLLSLTLLIIPSINTTATRQIPPQQTSSNMPMPSVADVFGGMSQDEITKQVQEAQKLFESLSPEEMAEFEKIIEQTIQTMSPQDLEDIAGIAKMVEPHLELPAEKPQEPTKAEPKEEKIKEEKTTIKEKKEETSDTNNIQQLIDNISYQLDNFLQKINSDKSLFEEVFNKWASKITFDNMKRQILTLKQNRLAKKLTTKENPEDKDLYKNLESFYKELKKLNELFEVEDEFGMSASPSKLKELIKQTKEILTLFDNTIDNLMPILEKFLRKYDPEVLQMAKEAEERKKQAETHAKDAAVRRGSAPAQAAPPGGPAIRQQPIPGGPSYPTDMGGYTNYPGIYDQYGMPQAGYDYPGAKNLGGQYPSSGTSTPVKKDEQRPNITKTDTKESQDSNNAYDMIEEQLEDHFDKHKSQNLTTYEIFLKDEYVSKYPDADAQAKIPVPNIQINLQKNEPEQLNWINSTGNFAAQAPGAGGPQPQAGGGAAAPAVRLPETLGFKVYTEKFKNASKKLQPIADEIKSAQKTLEKISESIHLMDTDKLKKVNEHKLLKTLKDRFTKYKSIFEKNNQDIDTTYQKNLNVIDGKNAKPLYELTHKDFTENFEQALPFDKILSDIDSLHHKIDRTINKKKTKKQSKAARAVQI